MADWNPQSYANISSTLPRDRHMFVQGDVSSWQDQASTFKKAFDWSHRIDFFAANAGIGDKENVFAQFDLDADPAKPDLKCLDVNQIAVFYGLKLFIHYSRKTRRALANDAADFKPSMTITASSASLYPFPFAVQYAASKHALLGLTRAVGPRLLAEDGISVNCIMPAFVATALAPPGIIDAVPQAHLTPMSTIMRAFEELMSEDESIGGEWGNGKGSKRKSGQAVECVEGDLFYRDPIPYMSEGSRWLAEEDENGGLWDPKKAHGVFDDKLKRMT